MQRLIWSVSVLLAVVVPSVTAADLAAVRLKARTFVPVSSLEAIDAPLDEPRHVFVQLLEPLTPTLRDELADDGVVLLRYIPDHTWIASIAPAAATNAEVRRQLAWAGDIRVEDKLPARLLEGRGRSWARQADGRMELRVRYHDDVVVEAANAALIAAGAEMVAPMSVFPGATVLIDEAAIAALAAQDAVMWISEGLPEPVLENDGSRSATGAGTLQVNPYGLSGVGVHLGIWDGGTDPNHDDFAGRITIVGSAGVSDHGTHVAGTAGGSGLLSESRGGTPLQWRGMAPEVSLFAASFGGDIIGSIESAVGTFDLDIETNSWGFGVDGSNCEDYGDYDGLAPEFDAIVRGSGGRKISVTFSAGNERNDGDCPLVEGAYGCLNMPKPAKNIIVVGATNSDNDTMTSFSSWGPVDDGRLKPDVTAPGCEQGGEGAIRSTLPGDTYGGPGWCGTSMASPAVAGHLALLVELYRAISGLETPEPSLMKALLVTTSDDLGNAHPDYAFGHGRVNGPAAANALLDDTQHVTPVGNGEVLDFTFEVPAGLPRLRLALVWDDPDAAPLSDPALVNNLDLELIGGAGTTHPWVLDPSNPSAVATRGVDALNNVEHITVEGPQPGTWTARVTGTNVPEGPQIASLVGLDSNAPDIARGLTVGASSSTTLDLTWFNAAASDRKGTLLVRTTNGGAWVGPVVGATYAVGQVLAPDVVVAYVADENHSLTPFTDTGLEVDTTYGYTAYSFDDFHNYSAGTMATGSTGTTVGVTTIEGPSAVFELQAAMPNPARKSTSIRFGIADGGLVQLRIFGPGGRHVRTLVDGSLESGIYSVDWDGRDIDGRAVSPGVYFYEIRTSTQRESKRLVWSR